MLMKGSIALKYYFLNQLFKNFKKEAGGKLKFVIEKKTRLYKYNTMHVELGS